MATTITLSGRLSDVTDRSIESVTKVTVKAPAYRPGPDVDIITSQPAVVDVPNDGRITLNVVAGVGWLYLEGDGWTDSIRFVAATGMTTLWEAVVNALPNSAMLADLLEGMQAAGMAIEEAKRKALLALREEAVKASLTWNRGKPPQGESPEQWESGQGRQGIWDIPDWSSITVLKNLGYNPPADMTPHFLMHMDRSLSGASGSVQIAYTADGKATLYKRSREYNKPWGPWGRFNAFGTGNALDFRGDIAAAGKTPNDLTGADNGVWMVTDWGNLRYAAARGYQPPLDAAPHMIRHEENSNTKQAIQTATYIFRQTGEQFIRTKVYGKSTWSQWQRRDTTDLSATNRTAVLAIGDSWVEGGANNVLWTDGAAWADRLAQELGVAVKNAGKGGAVVDETALAVGARRTFLKIKGGIIPGEGESVEVTLNWSPAIRSPRWFSAEGFCAGARVFLEQNGVTGAWTLRRGKDKALNGMPLTVGDGWIEWQSGLSITYGSCPTILHIGINNTGGTRGPHPEMIDHVVAGIGQIVDSRPNRAHDIIVMSITPHYGKKYSLDVVTEINARLKAAYPRQFFDNFGFLKDLGDAGAMQMAGLTITDGDREDVANGFAPRSLYPAGEVVHVDKPAHAAIAKKLAEFIRNRGMVAT
ncbi:hypothetical protein [Corynebacterium jeddahense]|nr:hypothetical protein [Corynebacterium jeddahense]